MSPIDASTEDGTADGSLPDATLEVDGSVPDATSAESDASLADVTSPEPDASSDGAAPVADASGMDAAVDASEGDAAQVCAGGTADCDGVSSNGCEVNIAGDTHNCGACGHDCLGSACRDGACSIDVLAQGLTGPFGLAVDSSRVYFSLDVPQGQIVACPLAGCGSGNTLETVLVKDIYGPFELAVDSANIYFTNNETSFAGPGIAKCPLTGCVPTTSSMTSLANQLSSPYAIAIDSTSAYFTSYSTVGSVNKDGTSLASPLATFSQPVAIAVDPTSIYVGSGNGLTVMAKDGTGQMTLATTAVEGIALDTSNVYFTSADGSVNAMAQNGAVVTALVTSQYEPSAIIVSGAYVYWVNRGGYTPNQFGSIARCPIAGCGTNGEDLLTLASAQSYPSAIAVDASYVYWVNEGSGNNPDGSVMRVAK